MSIQSSRRDFFKYSGLAATAATFLTGPSIYAESQDGQKAELERQIEDLKALYAKSQDRQKQRFSLGLASYTTRKLSLEQTIEMTGQLGLTHLSLKDMHLPLKSTPAELAAAAEKIRNAKLTFYAAGVIYMKSAEDVDQAFDYAKAAEIKTIVGVPNHDLLDRVNRKAVEYDMQVAIHNHGPGDKLYPTPESVYEKIKPLDKRLGLCIDIGHTERSGIKPAEAIERFADRLLDVHLKDVTASTKDGTTVEMGRGVIDIPAVMRTLLKIGYSRVASFEYEKNADDPLAGLAESVGYTRGVLAAL